MRWLRRLFGKGSSGPRCTHCDDTGIRVFYGEASPVFCVWCKAGDLKQQQADREARIRHLERGLK